MKVVSVLAALACCATTLTLAFGPALAGMATLAADSVTALTAHPALDGFDLPEALALLGAFVVFWSSTRSSQDT
jgi:hypothetical protein